MHAMEPFNPNSTGLLATCNTPGAGGIQRHATEIILPDGILTNGKKHCVGMKKIRFFKIFIFLFVLL